MLKIGQFKIEAFQECGRLASKAKQKAIRKLVAPPPYITYKGQLPEAERYGWSRNFLLKLTNFVAEYLSPKPFKNK